MGVVWQGQSGSGKCVEEFDHGSISTTLRECYSHVRVFEILNNDVYNNSYYLIKLMKTDLILPGIAGLELGIGMTKGGRG